MWSGSMWIEETKYEGLTKGTEAKPSLFPFPTKMFVIINRFIELLFIRTSCRETNNGDENSISDRLTSILHINNTKQFVQVYVQQ